MSAPFPSLSKPFGEAAQGAHRRQGGVVLDQTYFEGWWEGASLFIHPASLQREANIPVAPHPLSRYTPPSLPLHPS